MAHTPYAGSLRPAGRDQIDLIKGSPFAALLQKFGLPMDALPPALQPEGVRKPLAPTAPLSFPHPQPDTQPASTPAPPLAPTLAPPWETFPPELQRAPSGPIRATLTDAVTSPDGSHTEFVVRVEACGAACEVRRRFTAFLGLHASVADLLDLPPFPAQKKWRHSASERHPCQSTT